MKTKLFFLLFFAFTSATFGQDKYTTLLKIKELYDKEIVKEGDKYVSFDEEKRQLTLSEYVINITEETLFEYQKEKENGKIQHQVHFHCQNGTTVIDKTNLSKKRAWLALTFKSKEACYELMALLEKLGKS